MKLPELDEPGVSPSSPPRWLRESRPGSKQNKDGFELWLTGLLDNMLGPTATSRISVAYEDFPEGTVCRIDVSPGTTPTFVRSSKGGADLYVRLNNSTRLLNTADSVEYVSSHWR